MSKSDSGSQAPLMTWVAEPPSPAPGGVPPAPGLSSRGGAPAHSSVVLRRVTVGGAARATSVAQSAHPSR